MLHFIVYVASLNYDDLLETENPNSDKKTQFLMNSQINMKIITFSLDNYNLE